MKKSILFLLAVYAWVLPPIILAQEVCEPQYSVSNYVHPTAATSEVSRSGEYRVALTVGQPLVMGATNYSTNSVNHGFWSYYLKEPRPPVLAASDGDYQDRVYLEWTVEDDRTGPPVTGDLVTIYRNRQTLTTLPVTQTDYQDFYVFPGEYYVYGVTSTNSMGESHTDDNIGFLNPNGIITGRVQTPSGNPVLDTKVMLTPNLGKSAFFDGSSYIYFFDEDTGANRLFSGLEGEYTIETWFRSVHVRQQTLFAAVDSAAADHYVLLELTEEGKVRWQHSPTAGESGAEIVTVNSYAGTGSDWHHLAVVFSSDGMSMYIDGAIVGEAASPGAIQDTAEIILGKRSPRTHTLFFRGRLDDFRIWSMARTWEDIRKHMDLTLSGEERNLAAYWKFDEAEGDIIFDLTEHDIDGGVCGIERDDFTAPVYVGALTDSLGHYAIKGIYYADGTTFTVTPKKETSIGRSLEFDGADDYISFEGQRIDLTGGYTLEGWFKTSAGTDQTIFAGVDPADGSHRLSVKTTSAGKVTFSHYASEITSTGTYNDELWHHYAVTSDSTTMVLYVDGEPEGTAAVQDSIPDLSEMVIARQAPEVSAKYFKGYLDEMRIWNYARTVEQVGGTMNQTLEGDNYGLIHYWRINEGSGDLVADDTGNLVTGTVRGARWSEDIPLKEVFTHMYEPESRQATLMRNITAVDRVDFTDISMIAVSGYVRYENTACFQEDVEVLLNGESFRPPIYTDENGKFIVELEPGSIGDLLSVAYQDHEFVPPYIELPMITRPITGLYFDDRVTRDVRGKVAGGVCEFPITPSQGQIEVNFRAINGCVERTVVPHVDTGLFEVLDLPPLIYQVTIDHPDPEIDAFFTGDTLSLEEGDREVNFIYRSEPEVTITGFPVHDECGMRVMEMLQEYTLDVHIFETYINFAAGDTNTCPSDSGTVVMGGQISETSPDTTYEFTNGLFQYTLKAGNPNLLGDGDHPYQKNIQATITDKLDRSASVVEWTVVTGNRPRETFYATTSPEIPLMIIHAPPGDGSSAHWTSGTTVEQSIGFAFGDAINIGMYLTAHLGPDITTSVGFGTTVDLEIDVTLDMTASMNMTMRNSSFTEQTWSFETTEAVSTVDGGDVFIGGAINILYGITDVLKLDDGCNVVVEAKPIVVPDGFATTYVYSETYINDVVIPSLYTTGEDASAERWKNYLAINEGNRASATFVENRSFDAGTVYEFEHTETITETTGWEFEMEVEAGFALDAGVQVNGVGITGGVNVGSMLTTGRSGDESKTTTNTFGYTFADDDIGDAFTVDILTDNTYGSPVFKVVSGASSCPWEPGTVPYDGPSLGVTPPSQTDVLPDEPAVFDLIIGNTSQMDADREYHLRVIHASNPDGAVIAINGNILEDFMSFFVPAGEQVQATMTVDRGPTEYVYNDLQLQLVSSCQFDLADTISVHVSYMVPCSEVHIAVPEEGWLVTSADESDTLWVTLNGYDRFGENLERLELQYRRGGGDWFVAYTVPKDSLIDDYVLMPWNISPSIVIDGTYQLRGRAVCGGDLAAGTSNIVTGVIDRNPPEVLGAPEPSDGILHPDDQIAITFNEDVEGGKISVGAGHITLTNTVTGEPVDFTYTSGGNVVVIDPNIQNHFIENQTLRASVGPVEDLHGNVQTVPIEWEFFVNRNPIEWAGLSIENEVIYVDEEYTTTRTLHNTGGSNRSYELVGEPPWKEVDPEERVIPSWLEVSPLAGTIGPGSAQTITFRVSGPEVGYGTYRKTIYASGTMGDEPMPVDVRVLCYEPVWTFNPSDYQYTMTITATLSTDGEFSDDVYDIVGVFVGEELRGVANVEYIPEFEHLPNTHPYEVFLTVYSNVISGEELSFRVWDASECRELGMVEEAYVFEANVAYGTPTSPATITATSQIISSLAFPAGWTWFSLNLEASDMSANAVLTMLEPASGDLIKSQTAFDQYVPDVGWIGTLDMLRNQPMYLIKLADRDTLEMIGYAVDVETDTTAIVSGWNWIGYSPQQSFDVDYALSSLEAAATGDLIKSQFEYAQFVEGIGWIGSLSFMAPKLGYLLYSMHPGELLYPFYEAPPVAKAAEPVLAEHAAGWVVNPAEYEYTMTLTGVIEVDGAEVDTTADVLAAFVGGECRGIAQPLYIPEMDRFVTFLMIYSNRSEGEKIRLRLFDASEGWERRIAPEVAFRSDAMLGTVGAPFALEARPLGIGDPGYIPERFMLGQSFPNPFNFTTRIGYGLPKDGEVEMVIYNLLGQRVRMLLSEFQPAGYRFVRWDGRDEDGNGVSTGIYFYVMEAGDFREAKKLVLLK